MTLSLMRDLHDKLFLQQGVSLSLFNVTNGTDTWLVTRCWQVFVPPIATALFWCPFKNIEGPTKYQFSLEAVNIGLNMFLYTDSYEASPAQNEKI